MRQVFAAVLEVAGLAAVSVGAFTISAAVGFIVSGIAAIGVGFFLERE